MTAALGIREGEAHVIRNAGGRAPEALRSLIISQQLLNTEEILVIQHSDCGMLTFTSEQARGLIAQQLNLDANSAGAKTLNQLDFLDFPELEKNVKSDVDFLKNNELIKVCKTYEGAALISEADAEPFLTIQGHKVTGYIYDVKTGSISQVA